MEALTRQTSGSPAPVGAEIKFLYHVKRVFGQHLEFSADIRQVTICPCTAWPRPFVRYHVPVLDIGKSVGDEKRVASDFFQFRHR